MTNSREALPHTRIVKNARILLTLGALTLLASGFGQSRKEASPLAPEFAGSDWVNAKPMTLASRRGRPTLVAFWTFGCSNCQANLPAYRRLYEKYKPLGVELVAIHTPELKPERDRANVVKHIDQFGIKYPVLTDNDGTNWNRWQVRYWPTIFVVDGSGRIRYRWEGELAYKGAPGEQNLMTILDGLLK